MDDLQPHPLTLGTATFPLPAVLTLGSLRLCFKDFGAIAKALKDAQGAMPDMGTEAFDTMMNVVRVAVMQAADPTFTDTTTRATAARAYDLAFNAAPMGDLRNLTAAFQQLLVGAGLEKAKGDDTGEAAAASA